MELPAAGTPRTELLERMQEISAQDADWRGGKIWSLVYYAGEEVSRVLTDVYSMYFFTNGLGPAAFKSLKKLESEVVAMTAGLLGRPEAAGNMTSGGTESILMAVKTARDWARANRPEITAPEMVLPVTAHPAFDKAAHYLGLKAVHVHIAEDLRADVAATGAALSDNTVLVVGSAPCYPFGVIDPIPALAALAAERGIPCHVAACLGGYLLPFLPGLGYDVPPWDFSVPGVTSISADLHKCGFSARGSSTILYRDREMRRHQFFAQSDWPGGLYGSPTMTGSRPGGGLAASRAVLNYPGGGGYTRLARTIMEATRALRDGVNAVPGLHIMGQPDMSVFAFTSDSLDVYAVADAMDARGWNMDRQQKPPSLHIMVTPAHAGIVPQFL